MKFDKLVTGLTACLTVSLNAAPTPEPLELILSIDSAIKSSNQHSEIQLRFVGAPPSTFYDMKAKVDHTPFQIGLTILPLISSIYISLQTACSQNLLCNIHFSIIPE